MSAGKGDRPRPVNKNVYDSNYDRIKWSRRSNDQHATRQQRPAIKQPASTAK